MNLPRLSVWYKASIDAIDRALQRLSAPLTGAAIVGTASCVPSLPGGMTVQVSAGTVRVNGILKAVALTNVVLPAGSGAGSRVDIVYIDTTGVAQQANGTPADPNTPPGPQDPDLPVGCALVAILLIPANAGSLTAAMLYDARVFGQDDDGLDTKGTWTWTWDGKQGLRSTLTGTGTYAIGMNQISYSTFGTGAGAGSTSSGDVTISIFGSKNTGSTRWLKLYLAFNNIDANTSAWAFWTDEQGFAAPTNTVRHLGIRTAGGVVFFSTADGITEQTTDISAFVLQGTDYQIDITYDGTTARCYINGNLRATHSTNVPSSVGLTPPNLKVYITNNAAAAIKLMFLQRLHAIMQD